MRPHSFRIKTICWLQLKFNTSQKQQTLTDTCTHINTQYTCIYPYLPLRIINFSIFPSLKRLFKIVIIRYPQTVNVNVVLDLG